MSETDSIDELTEEIDDLSTDERAELLDMLRADRLADYLDIRGEYIDRLESEGLISAYPEDSPWAEYCQKHPNDRICQEIISWPGFDDLRSTALDIQRDYLKDLREAGFITGNPPLDPAPVGHTHRGAFAAQPRFTQAPEIERFEMTPSFGDPFVDGMAPIPRPDDPILDPRDSFDPSKLDLSQLIDLCRISPRLCGRDLIFDLDHLCSRHPSLCPRPVIDICRDFPWLCPCPPICRRFPFLDECRRCWTR